MIIIDRIEGNFAVCEFVSGGQTYVTSVELSEICGKAAEGDVLKCENGVLSVDSEQTRLRRERAARLSESLFE